MPNDGGNHCNYLMGCWLVKCFSFILYMLAWLSCQGKALTCEHRASYYACVFCMSDIGFGDRKARSTWRLTETRRVVSWWALASESFPAVPGANRWTQRYCCRIVVFWGERRETEGTWHPLWTWSEPGVRVSSVAALTAGGGTRIVACTQWW